MYVGSEGVLLLFKSVIGETECTTILCHITLGFVIYTLVKMCSNLESD